MTVTVGGALMDDAGTRPHPARKVAATNTPERARKILLGREFCEDGGEIDAFKRCESWREDFIFL